MAKKSVVRLGDTGSHGGTITTGSPTIFVNDRPMARVGDTYTCPIHGANPIITGTPSIFGEHVLVAHIDSQTACGAVITTGSLDTFVDVEITSPSSMLSIPFAGPHKVKSINPLKDSPNIKKCSPTLEADLIKLKSQGWRIVYAQSGKGHYTRIDQKTIYLDPDKDLLSALTHEVGHAKEPLQDLPLEQASCVQTLLDYEGVAVFRNLEIRDEILKNCNMDIGIDGENFLSRRHNLEVYQQYKDKKISKNEAIKRLGEIVGTYEKVSATQETYRDTYGKACEERREQEGKKRKQ